MTVTKTRRAVTDVLQESRRRSALALLGGALVLEVLVQQDVVRFYYTPLIIGLTYLTAAVVGGRRGTLWAPGLVTTCWGIAVLLGVHGLVTIDAKLSYEIAGGIGVVIALLLYRFTLTAAAGWVGLGVSMGAIVLHDYGHPPAWVFRGVTFAVLLALWGLWELRPSAPTSGPLDETDVDASQSRGAPAAVGSPRL